MDAPAPDSRPPAAPAPGAARSVPALLGLLIFGFGLAAGFLLSFSGYAVLEDSASLVVTVFLAALFAVGVSGTVIFLFRRPILRRITGLADAQLELFAAPLAEVADSAVRRDPERATAAARDLVQLTLARYGWILTRRWIIASLTGLIAAMAALAGTALLFKQNQLLAHQSALLAEQNAKLGTQIGLLAQDIELAEASRNADLAVEITRIADLLGDAMLRADARRAGDAAPADAPVPVLDPLTDIDQRLVMRITAASRAVKPYRFLRPSLNAHDDSDKLRVAMAARRDDLPASYARMSGFFGWAEDAPPGGLIDRPASPERGQLLDVLVRSGLSEFERLNWFGLDLSFAWAEDIRLLGLSMQGAQLSYAHFDRAQIVGSDLGGAYLENARFRGAWIRDSLLRGLDGAAARGPYAVPGAVYTTALAGADFTGALLQNADLSRVNGGAASFDAATLAGVDFRESALAGATFRGAVLAAADFTGAALNSVEFDGAFVFGADFLDRLAEAAAPGTFRPDRFTLEPSSYEAALATRSAFATLGEEGLRAASGSDEVWVVRRVQPFE